MLDAQRGRYCAMNVVSLGVAGGGAVLLYLFVAGLSQGEQGPSAFKHSTAFDVASVLDEGEPASAEDDSQLPADDAVVLFGRAAELSLDGEAFSLQAPSVSFHRTGSVLDTAPKQGPPFRTALL